MLKRWQLRQADEGAVARLAEELNVRPLIAKLLAHRGIIEPDAARRYLSSSLRSDLPSPFLMTGMEKAAERLAQAVAAGELLCVWGDYDVDGTTGTATIICFLREIGAEPIYYIPHRIDEGYGLNMEGLKQLRERGVSVVISVDCGVSNYKEIEFAASLGLSVIVVDHHQPPEELPPAFAILNPHQRDCAFPDKGLCGAGLAFYLVIALRAKLRDLGWFKGVEPDLRTCLDVVTLGTIADMVPLKGVNRVLSRRGLEVLGGSTRPGIIALKKVAGVRDGEVTAGQVGFRLGPRINAAGRMDAAVKVVQMLTTTSADDALKIAEELDAHNRERQATEAKVLEAALELAGDDIGGRYSLVLGEDGWHPGVLGIVASRIVEKFHRPTVVIGFQDGQGKGSARSIRGFHMVDGLRSCADCLEKFGGHEYAGGLTVRRENFSTFAERFETIARATLAPEDLTPLLEVDAQLDFSAIGMELMKQLSALEPFGIGNPEPLFMTRGVEIADRKTINGGARFKLRHSGKTLGAVAFGLADGLPESQAKVDIVYRLNENEWNDTYAVELRIIDGRPSAG
ncbi:MAG TPA: single-stranded-DNA-specific exonuclease RecJ [Verrucomicrobiae bacterium]|jgi:single-stranded-DNA-specific exonuclease|nr:single-stranded-DNA-specific exonuclease RecJ [Verrucomicrobiae bacterium]